MFVPPCPPVVFFQVLLCGRRLLCWRLKTKGKENDGDVPWWAPCHVPACPLCFLLEDRDKDIETGKKKMNCAQKGDQSSATAPFPFNILQSLF